MIFPEFNNMQIIDDIRTKYDPLAKLVRPHITLVFPFESEMSDEDVATILDKRLDPISPRGWFEYYRSFTIPYIIIAGIFYYYLFKEVKEQNRLIQEIKERNI